MNMYQSFGIALIAAAALGGCSSFGKKQNAGADVSVVRQAPSAESLEELLTLQNFDQVLDDAFRQMPEAALAQTAGSMQNVPADRRGAVNQVLQKYLTLMTNEFNTPQLRAELRRVSVEGASKVYTQREVDALIRFYKTREGRSVMEKMPQYMRATTVPMIQVMSPQIESLLKKYTPQMNVEINRALCGKDRCPTPARAKK